ncbi:MAG: hypothetical protein CMF64_06170 [Magnetovibrio sp.]|nr:hypothetical protein [Magnetovibrio sp.]
MCELCGNDDLHLHATARRKRLWEMTPGWHCSILGTCLTLADLRALSRKLPLKTRPGFPVDYQLHGFFVKEADQPGRAAKMLTKLLDRKHAAAIRRLRGVKDAKGLEDAWVEALAAGDIPGPYWAILSHPAATTDLSERMFADVHMLSHLVGASNRGDIRRLTDLEEENAGLRDKIAKQQNHHRQRLDEKEKQINELRDRLQHAPERAIRIAAPAVLDSDGACTSVPALQGELRHMEIRAAQTDATLRGQRSRIDELSRLVESLLDENRSLETALVRERENGLAGDACDTSCPFDLSGRCLLYVGGRQQTVHRLKSLVEAWNGQFLHHDGGLEKSINELAGAVVKADAVVFPTDCVSHDAALQVKRLCRQSMKPFVPLRSSGVASFVAGLRQGLESFDAMAGAD